MEVDGESYKSWEWWLDALQAMRRTYSLPMDAKEARIRADVAEAMKKEAAAAVKSEGIKKGRLVRWISRTQDPKKLRAAAEEARREDRLMDERKVVDRWVKSKDPEAVTYQNQLGDEEMEMHLRTKTEERHVENEDRSDDDREAVRACEYRSKWKYLRYGDSYEDTTAILAMPYTDDVVGAKRWTKGPTGTLQIFSFKVAAIAAELRWPLDVYGLIAIRDYLDRRRNIIFARARDNCETITSENPYLTLAGPTRAAVLSDMWDSVRFEVVLKAKSSTNESEDKDLSFLARKFRIYETKCSRVIKFLATSKLSKLEWTVGYLAKSVEATISIQVIHGSWPEGCRGTFSASTISIDEMNFSLLSLEDDKLPVTADGMITLSRHVACVEIEGELKISVATEYANGEQVAIKDVTIFTPRAAGRSSAILKVHSCEMRVIVAWSLVCSG